MYAIILPLMIAIKWKKVYSSRSSIKTTLIYLILMENFNANIGIDCSNAIDFILIPLHLLFQI